MRSRLKRGAAAVAAALVAVLTAPAPATAAGLDVVAVMTSADEASVALVADVRPPAKPDSFTVRAGTANLPARSAPLFSDQLALGLVVDASETGGAALQPGLSGAANLLLQAPAGARTAIVADTNPPALASPLRAGPADALFALSAVEAGGARQTSDAITLALRQLPATPAGPRVLLLYTGASFAGDEPADALADRLAGSHTVLVVVTTSPDTGYWREVTNATGGHLVAAQRAAVIAAFDEVANVLRNRYLVTFASPGELPAPVSVRASAGGQTLTADAIVPAAEPAEAPRTERSNTLWLVALGAGVLTIVAGAATLVVARRVQPAAPPS